MEQQHEEFDLMATLHKVEHLLKLVVYCSEERMQGLGRTMKIARGPGHKIDVTFDVVHAEVVVVERHREHVSAGPSHQ